MNNVSRHTTMQVLGLTSYVASFWYGSLLLMCLQTDNQANVYGGVRTNVSTDAAVKWYLANGATAGKINMGEIRLPVSIKEG